MPNHFNCDIIIPSSLPFMYFHTAYIIVIVHTFTSLSAPFIIGGILKIAYDIALYINFRKIKPPEEEEKQ
jgi:hypothetical protein